ncbi:hypothetical protein [Deinococcus yunweiensis]|uniref:hypothetical protein n=1 Tax=Deinococcus yunweiensis TaxID=367282 RepID=UPI00398EE744
MIRPALLILALSVLASPAQALKMSVWDRELQTKLGDGETVGGVFTARLVGNYQGPVVVLFALSDEEKLRGTYSTLKTRYDGALNDGQLSLQLPAGTDRAASAPNGALTLSKFLNLYRLRLTLQPTGETLSLPGLKVITPASSSAPLQAPARQGK